MLIIGLVSGAILAALYMGAQSGDDTQLGTGLKALYEQHRNRVVTDEPKRPNVPARKPPPTAKFDFYTVLPEIERVMPDDFKDVDVEPKRGTKPVVYILQAASYANYADADRLKAKLALSGFEPTVQKVVIEGKGVYYRVRLGPYSSKRKMKNDKQRLAKLGISSLPLRLSGGARELLLV
jgi:cell division protein FtsN